MALLGALCKDMLYFSRLPWLSDTNPKSMLLFQTVAGGGGNEKKAKTKLGNDVDWLQMLLDMLEDPVVCAVAGSSRWTTRQFLYLKTSAQILEVAANKKIQVLRNKQRENEEHEEKPIALPLFRSAAIFGLFSSFLIRGIKTLYQAYFPEDIEPPLSPTAAGLDPAAKTLARASSQTTIGEAEELDDTLPTDSTAEMEARSYLLDSGTTAMLMLSHKPGASGALELINITTMRIYNVLHYSLLDEYHSLTPAWTALTSLETKWMAFSAFMCIQRWHEHQVCCRDWAIEARTICLERLRLNSIAYSADSQVPSEDEPRAAPNFIHNSMAIDEGLRLQKRKNKLIAEAEDIISMSHIIGAKLEVLCRKFLQPNGKTAKSNSTQMEISTDCKYDGDAKFEVLSFCSI
jgi:hypothetical protein